MHITNMHITNIAAYIIISTILYKLHKYIAYNIYHQYIIMLRIKYILLIYKLVI